LKYLTLFYIISNFILFIKKNKKVDFNLSFEYNRIKELESWSIF